MTADDFARLLAKYRNRVEKSVLERLSYRDRMSPQNYRALANAQREEAEVKEELLATICPECQDRRGKL